MTRPPRHDEPGAWHHIMNRGADRQDVLTDDDDRLLFEHHLGELDRLGLFETHAYCLMTNHFHLLGRTHDGTLSAALHRLSSEYVRYYNDRHRRDGPLFRNRFLSKPIVDDDQLVVAVRYVHRNPLAFAQLEALPNYRWSSLGAYLGTRTAPAWLHREVVDERFVDAAAHWAHVSRPLDSDASVGTSMLRGLGIELPDVAVAVARTFGGAADSATPAARQMAVTLATELRVASSADIADAFGLRSPSAARTMARRGRVLIADDAAYAALRLRVLRALVERAA